MKTTLMFILSSLLLCGSVYADTGAKACQADIQKYCPDAKPGGGAIGACLKQNASSLSADCVQYLQMVKQKVQTFASACAADIKTHCTGVQPGGGRIYQCLKQHEDQLGAACQDQMKPSSN